MQRHVCSRLVRLNSVLMRYTHHVKVLRDLVLKWDHSGSGLTCDHVSSQVIGNHMIKTHRLVRWSWELPHVFELSWDESMSGGLVVLTNARDYNNVTLDCCPGPKKVLQQWPIRLECLGISGTWPGWDLPKSKVCWEISGNARRHFHESISKSVHVIWYSLNRQSFDVAY